ncbi:hypothetical protein [Nocardioides sp. AX2bis]|uniref:hypothetical protein n=1 Tax=Nocardioides sp. AX2bis TaxID=2653157 RepID=UPI0012EFBFA2|nr:hypothetical protein [Nocardioides sp. AX2bis]VXC49209.1 conserved hypothetical protein [Nocardioides sp. AX2bis]
MRFTEHEMTVGVEAVARELFAATRPPWKRQSVVADFESLDKARRYRHKAAAGEVVLPVLTALPDRPTVGATPAFTDEEWREAAEQGSRQVLDFRTEGGWEALGERKRRKLLDGAVALARVAVAAMPLRSDPDALVVPDHL